VLEQLYTARGSQGAGIKNNRLEHCAIDFKNYTQTFLQTHWYITEEPLYFDIRPLFTYEDTPPYLDDGSFNLMSIPMISFLGGTPSIMDIKYDNLYIQMNDPDDQATINAMVADFKEVLDGSSYTIRKEEEDKTADVDQILTKVFVVVIAITMFLCFFSLSASMSANLYE